MSKLIKIKEVADRYDITARTLRYYEDMGLIESTRVEDYAYRMYDNEAIQRLEQILILRKMNIKIKDIKRVFDSSDSDVVLEVLGKKVEKIDDEVSLLHELRGIVLEFIQEIEQVSFSDNSDIKLLYNKAKDIEAQLTGSEYEGKPAKINRLVKVTEKLNDKIPDIMVVKIPSFKAITSKEQDWEDIINYKEQLFQYSHLYQSVIFDCFDFFLPKNNNKKAEWICALKEDVTDFDVNPLGVMNFPGGLYAMAVSMDEDTESWVKVEDKVKRWVENTNFELDKSRGTLFNLPYFYEDGKDSDYLEIKKGLGYTQMQMYFPIKLKPGI